MKNNTANRMKQRTGITVRLLVIAVICIALSACAGSVQPKYPERDIPSTTVEVIAGASTDAEKLERLFLYARDEIDFNWIYPQDIPAEEVLQNGFGVCMQKANLLSAMARQAGFQTRFRFVYVHKQALEDFLPSYIYEKWADPFPHTVVEIMYQGRWRSFDPSFDRRLYDICLDKEINFGRYPEIVTAHKTGFSPEGMKGTQEFWEATDRPSFHGDTLEPLLAWEDEHVCFLKRLMKPFIFRKGRSIMDALRG